MKFDLLTVLIWFDLVIEYKENVWVSLFLISESLAMQLI